MIDSNILITYNAVLRRYKKGEMIFKEGGKARFYYQVYSGIVKMFNTGDGDQEFVQGIFNAGESFGEPAVFGSFNYPAAAAAIEDSEVLVLEKNKLIALLKENFDIHLGLLQTLSKRLQYKSMMAKEITMHDAAHRILSVIDFIKERDDNNRTGDLYAVTLTRQQLADLTGMRVETVIRTVRQLVDSGKLKQIGRKVYR